MNKITQYFIFEVCSVASYAILLFLANETKDQIVFATSAIIFQIIALDIKQLDKKEE